MDNTQDLVFRGKTGRRRKRNTLTQKEKRILNLFKRRKELWKQRHKLGYEKLDKPYQRGFVRFFVLRKDVATSKYGAFYQELLPYINCKQFSSRAGFMKRKKRRKHGKRQYKLRTQTLEELGHKEFNKLPDKFKPHFVKQEKRLKNGSTYLVFIFKEVWRYQLIIEPHIITHKRKIDTHLERELGEIENYMDKHQLHRYYSKLKGQSFNYYDWESKRRKQNKPVYLQLEKLNHE